MFAGVYDKKRVLITGNTGFKGSWMALWLLKLGAEIWGYSSGVLSDPSHHQILNLPYRTTYAAITDYHTLKAVIADFKPDIIFHLAAQAYVQESYVNPIDTFSTNIMGTAFLLEACRSLPSIKGILNVTSDKCYDNREWFWGYRESDPLGGHDPYSASKACSEIIADSYRKSFWGDKSNADESVLLLATARAGNVIGGGDWGKNRLIPDVMRATERKKSVLLRNHSAVRPWQHVLDALSAYLLIGQKMLEEDGLVADAWNVGPREEDAISVLSLVEKLKENWEEIDFQFSPDCLQHHEAKFLRLDCAKIYNLLGWRPVWNGNSSIEKTCQWYKAYYCDSAVTSEKHLSEYLLDAIRAGVVWAQNEDL